MKRYFPHIQILLAGSLWGLIGLFSRSLKNELWKETHEDL